ncbi:hypothetical protein [Nonomuraea cavernae]|uniref:PE domain-containing protein n=1 Tax=Nonomuraea cavernae TaxID=2045107 RepID=A0A918DPI5_9ACTN|nr:hypothetical protein [Nonomuraea cavernae]MCA2189376.1 hypothetical protein [Nonomuraea cavernae]GGO76966.1 hypothetical protein GCM10012289_55510 [Nonomuraea cavernae]
MTTPHGGYHVSLEGLQRRTARARDQADVWVAEREALREVFMREGNPLGNDQYGAALEKRLPVINEGVFGAFDAVIGELESVAERLRLSTVTYSAAEHVNGG